jgi:hypothetical protein
VGGHGQFAWGGCHEDSRVQSSDEPGNEPVAVDDCASASSGDRAARARLLVQHQADFRDVAFDGCKRSASDKTFVIALSKELEKLVAQMTVDQQGAIAMFEQLGFRAEALMRDHVKGADGRKHDIVLLSHDVVRVQSQMETYGLADVF